MIRCGNCSTRTVKVQHDTVAQVRLCFVKNPPVKKVTVFVCTNCNLRSEDKRDFADEQTNAQGEGHCIACAQTIEDALNADVQALGSDEVIAYDEPACGDCGGCTRCMGDQFYA